MQMVLLLQSLKNWALQKQKMMDMVDVRLIGNIQKQYVSEKVMFIST